MSERTVRDIAQRLSLREPQRESLILLDDLVSGLDLCSAGELNAKLASVREKYSSVESFEREFPSLCFALATGVGKTRLMGAFIAYLYREKKSRHFFVLAPNLTIYEKLKRDFEPNHPKYVFEGLPDFVVRPPGLITGETYEGTNVDAFDLQNDIVINIFNIAKINTEVRGGRSARIHKLSEYLGRSYFEYLAGLDDLVLLMDESHRYRASAGAQAINALKPMLGLELTATPIAVGARREAFRNVIYSYPLSAAMKNGYVKEPHVAGRENFKPENYPEDQLERLKLEDGMRVHENVRVKLVEYAQATGAPEVKPFVLVVAQTTEHAESLKALIDSAGFMGGDYVGKVITVHSNQSGELRDESVESLLNVESATEKTEVVIHVNKLGEGWDVRNLYTIIPLRSSASEILTEQTIGRGLRLPFGKRTGVKEIDTLYVVAHDKFNAIIDAAGKPDSIIRRGVVIGRDIPLTKEKPVVSRTQVEVKLFGGQVELPGGKVEEHAPLFATEEEQKVATLSYQALLKAELTAGGSKLTDMVVRERAVAAVKMSYLPAQGVLEGTAEQVDVAAVCEKVATQMQRESIRIPRIVVQPSSENRFEFAPFTLVAPEHRYKPVDSNILVQAIRTGEVMKIGGHDGVVGEQQLENYLVRHLIDFDDISYDDNADLLYDLSRQMVARLATYLEEEELSNVLQYHGRHLASIIHGQMQEHVIEHEADFEASFTRGMQTLTEHRVWVPEGEVLRDYREVGIDKQKIKAMVFDSFEKCAYFNQKFDVDTERTFASLLERPDNGVQKWVKPGRGQVSIYLNDGSTYTPDFVVEAINAMYMIETKAAVDMETAYVTERAKAAQTWCLMANNHLELGGKPWRYSLIPHDSISPTATFQALADRYSMVEV
ncbi:MAG: DEAD/DEAH box helicase family protein [Fimbriimonadaceae bacterium]|nr:DEAD/DEAH box helicase family protein [Fimbriimonadaceae bacterium]